MKLRKLRIVLAALFFLLLTMLFLDFTGVFHCWFSWMAAVQFVPALLASNFVIITVLLILTLLFGRVYCSVICPLGVLQDSMCYINKKSRKYPYHYRKPLTWLRVVMFVLMSAALILAIPAIYTILDPYSAFGRIAGNIFAPAYRGINNLLATIAEHFDSYAFYKVDVWVKAGASFFVAIITLVAIYFLCRKWGRIWCNTICPVGALLGFVSKFSIFKLVIDTDKCVGCTVCEKKCKASCINSKEHTIDFSRCVVCMDCIDNCSSGAIHYVATNPFKCTGKVADNTSDAARNSRRTFLAVLGLFATGAVKAQTKGAAAGMSKLDGGLAEILPKTAPERSKKIVPAGARSIREFSANCTACGLCITSCPNKVLRPSDSLNSFMQPEMSFERGYCRPECNECSKVCPNNAINPISAADKSSIQIGHAVWNKDLCVVFKDDVDCGNCARHCPNGAITMIASTDSKHKIPMIDETRCIGCGSCEFVCPSRPISAIHVEGHDVHKEI